MTCHCNFSTKETRVEGGWKAILKAIEKLGARHNEHVECYGLSTTHRLSSRAHTTSPINRFSYGIAHRGASVRIPRKVKAQKRGYLEDRRPASSMDPYIVTSKIAHTVLLA